VHHGRNIYQYCYELRTSQVHGSARLRVTVCVYTLRSTPALADSRLTLFVTNLSVFRQHSREKTPGFGGGGARENNVGREQFAKVEGDHATLLAVFRAFVNCGVKRRKEFCTTNAINMRAMQKANDIFNQLVRAAAAEGVCVESKGETTDPLARSLVAGYFLNTARRQIDGSFKTVATGQRLQIHPSSVLFTQPPEMIVFNELVKTSKLYARDVSAILPEWLAEMSPRTYSKKPPGGGAK